MAARHRPATVRERARLFRAAVATLCARLPEASLTIADVAHEVGTSPRQLQRIFHDIPGTTFDAVLRRARMERAAALIAHPYPVANIAAAVGYRQRAHFTKAFRRFYGELPSQMRVRLRSGNRGAAQLPAGSVCGDFEWVDRAVDAYLQATAGARPAAPGVPPEAPGVVGVAEPAAGD